MFHKASPTDDATAAACGAVATSRCVSRADAPSVAGAATPSVTVDLKYIGGRCTDASREAAFKRWPGARQPIRSSGKLVRDQHGCSCPYFV